LERLIGLHWVLSASPTVYTTCSGIRVSIAGQLDETRMLTVFASLPCQIKRIDRDTTPANTKAGINGMKPNGFVFAAPMAIAE